MRFPGGLCVVVFLLFIVGTLTPPAAYGDDGGLIPLPVRTIEDERRDVEYQCRFVNEDTCKQLRDRLKERITSERLFCGKNPSDARCKVSNKRKGISPTSLRERCAKEPYREECRSKKQKWLSKKERLRWLCARSPLSPECSNSVYIEHRISRKDKLEAYCDVEKNKRNYKCKSYLEEKKKRKEEKEKALDIIDKF